MTTDKSLPTQEEIDAGPHAGLGTIPSDYAKSLPELPVVAYRFSVPGIVKLDVWPHGGAWEKLVRKSDAEAALRAQAEEVAALRADARDLRDVLLRNGFVPCDIAACNCGSWHARFGLRERLQELIDDLTEAGHPLCNENGHLVRVALAALVAERDHLAASKQEKP